MKTVITLSVSPEEAARLAPDETALTVQWPGGSQTLTLTHGVAVVDVSPGATIRAGFADPSTADLERENDRLRSELNETLETVQSLQATLRSSTPPNLGPQPEDAPAGA